MLRKLRTVAGLSFREVEARAEALGSSMPHSTLVSTLNRTTLPREEVMVAFVRACGASDGQVAEWVTARQRISLATVTGQKAGRPSPCRHRFRFFLAGAAAGVTVCSGVVLAVVIRSARFGANR